MIYLYKSDKSKKSLVFGCDDPTSIVKRARELVTEDMGMYIVVTPIQVHDTDMWKVGYGNIDRCLIISHKILKIDS